MFGLITSGLAGAFGGGLIGVLKFFENKGESFDWKKFFWSLVPSVVVGLASGVLIGEPLAAFTAGLLGKRAWETYKKLS